MKRAIILACLLAGCGKQPEYYTKSVIAPDGQPAWITYSFSESGWKCPTGYTIIERIVWDADERWLIRCKP